MKINKVLVAALLLVSILALTVASQISQENIVSKINQITPTIRVEQKETCTASFYDEVQSLIGNCVYYNNYTLCLNTSGPNTACSLQQNNWTSPCKTGEITVTKNSTQCNPNNSFIISIDKGTVVLKKQIDYSEWGPCVYNVENACLIVTCQSKYDGANDGQFHGCKGGTSCQKFEICDNSIKTFYKNSREDFAEDDPSFYLNKLPLAEVAK